MLNFLIWLISVNNYKQIQRCHPELLELKKQNIHLQAKCFKPYGLLKITFKKISRFCFQFQNLRYPYKTNCDGKHLKYFSTYSRTNCYLESLTDFVKEKCQCVGWFMPGKICKQFKVLLFPVK